MGPIKGVRRGNYSTRKLQPNERVYCPKCNKSYKRRSILTHHIQAKHLKYNAVCPICSKQFISISNCNRYLKKVHHITGYSAFNLQFQPNVSTLRESPIMTTAVKENRKFGKHNSSRK